MKRKLAISAIWATTFGALGAIGALTCTDAYSLDVPPIPDAGRIGRVELAAMIDDAAHATGVPEVVLTAIVERDTEFGQPELMHSLFDSWVTEAKTKSAYSNLSPDELKDAVAFHGFAHVSGYVAKTFCSSPHNLMYSPVDNLVCAGRMLRNKIEEAKQAQDTSPSLTLWHALVLYRQAMTPDSKKHESESQYYADCVMARIGGLLLDVKGSYDSRVAHSLMRRKRAMYQLSKCIGKQCSVELINDGIGSRFAQMLSRVLGY